MSMFERDYSETADRLISTARRNPEGVLLLAAGVALLMRGIGAASGALQQGRQMDSFEDDDEGGNGRNRGTRQRGRTYAADMQDMVRQSANDIVSSTSRLANGAIEEAEYIVNEASSIVGGSFRRMMDEQPLTLALIGLAAGAAAGGMLPSVPAEERAMRPIGRRLSSGMDEATQRIKKSTRKARQRISEVAEEKGLNKQGLKEAVRDVASTFQAGLLEDEDRTPGNRPQGASSFAERSEDALDEVVLDEADDEDANPDPAAPPVPDRP